MLKNDYLVAKIGVDTAENEPRIASDVSALPSGLGRPTDAAGTAVEVCHFEGV